MWAEFCRLASAAAISTLTRGKTGDIAAAPAGAGFVDATLNECARVTTAEGYPPPAAVLDMYRRAYSRIGTAIAARFYSTSRTGARRRANTSSAT
jgi:ketopantoate reductase